MTIENDLELKHILETVKTVASVGVSSNPEKESHGIFRYLQEHGYRMIPVNPTALEILGEKAYPDLDSLPIPGGGGAGLSPPGGCAAGGGGRHPDRRADRLDAGGGRERAGGRAGRGSRAEGGDGSLHAQDPPEADRGITP